MSTAEPYLLVAAGLGIDPPLAPLLARLARRHRVLAHDPGLGAPAAVVAPAGTRRQRAWGRAPAAWWVAHPAGLAALGPEPPASVRLLLVPPPVAGAAGVAGGGELAGVPVEVVPAPGVDGDELRPVVPFVRERWRRRYGLPADLVVTVGVPGAPELDEATAHDALFLCAAAVVGPAHVLAALALATPVVCDAATAEAIGAVDGEHVVVAAGEAARTAAARLAADLPAAARLARAGRRLVEERHDLATAARRVAARLGLPPVGPSPVARLAGRLEELGTPVDAGVAGRAAGAIGSLGPETATWTARALRW